MDRRANTEISKLRLEEGQVVLNLLATANMFNDNYVSDAQQLITNLSVPHPPSTPTQQCHPQQCSSPQVHILKTPQ